MAEALASHKAVRPTDVRVQHLRVVRSERISSSFVRVTIGDDGNSALDFTPVGYDQWLRLFLPTVACESVDLPHGDAEGWYSRWLNMPEESRPCIRNYTVRDARVTALGWEIDVDFVVHRSVSGQVEGVGANWALNAQPGDPLGMLDQGRIFAPEDAHGQVVIASDESGLPGVEGILRSLGADTRAVVVLEVPHADDIRPLETAATVDIEWVIREHSEVHALAGKLALERLHRVSLDVRGYVYAVGEASFVLAARKRAQLAGLPKKAIDFCAYWRPARREKVVPA
jgi:NADPH-dependent ferric siderophore reductase